MAVSGERISRATNLPESRRASRENPLVAALQRLNAERPAGGRDALERVDRPERDVIRQLRLNLDTASHPARLLLTGQIGVGKSSELWHLQRLYRESERFLPIHCDLESQMSPERCGAIGVLLAMFRDALSDYPDLVGQRQPRRELVDRIMNDLVDWLGATKTGSAISFPIGGMDFAVDARPRIRSTPSTSLSAELHSTRRWCDEPRARDYFPTSCSAASTTT